MTTAVWINEQESIHRPLFKIFCWPWQEKRWPPGAGLTLTESLTDITNTAEDWQDWKGERRWWNVKLQTFARFLLSLSKHSQMPKYADIKTHKPHWNPPPLIHKQNNKAYFVLFTELSIYCGLWVCMHTHVYLWQTVIPVCFYLHARGPICLHYHHTAGGSRSVRVHGNSNASLSGLKKTTPPPGRLSCHSHL